jgi:hypothetical protein
MLRRTFLPLALGSAALVLAACTGTPPVVHPPLPDTPTVIVEPKDVDLPIFHSSDTPMVRATRLASYIESRWPRVHIEPDAAAMGNVVAFGITIDYDPFHGDEGEWEKSARIVAGDLRQASVELLELSARFVPSLAYASVWQERQLIFFWSKRQIEAMGRPQDYREFDAYVALTRLAEVQPPLLELARQRAAAPSPAPG